MISIHRHAIGLLLALLTATYGVPPTIAQPGDRSYQHPNSRFDVDFPGGTLEEYVASIRKARTDGAANIVVMPNAKNLAIPPIKLVGVTVGAAISILEGPYQLESGRFAEVDVRSYEIEDSEDRVIKIMAHFERPSIRSAVWSVEEALAHGQSADELLGAVEAVVALFHQKADISFHPPTRLLIARGTDEQLDLVREALSELINGAERRHEKITSLRDRINDLQNDRFRVEAELKVSGKEVEAAVLVLARRVKSLDEGQFMKPKERAHLEIQVVRLEARLIMGEQELHQIDRQLKSLKDDLKLYDTNRE